MRLIASLALLTVFSSGCTEPSITDTREDAGAELDADTPDSRDASDDAASGEPAGDARLALWLRADRGVLDAQGEAVAANGRVLRWVDQSARGFDATQEIDGEKPTFVAEGGPKGGPALVFDGTDDCLTLGANYIFSDKLGMTFFLVVRS